MDANLDKLSEMGKLLGEKDEVCGKMVTYFGLMGLGRMLSRLSLEKQQGVSIAQLLDDFIRSGTDLGEVTGKLYHLAASTLACYLEDIVADSGQWRSFSALCQQMFGWPVPIYHDATEEYYPDEPSLMAVRYLIYNAATELDDIWWKPELPQLDRLAQIAFAT